MKSFINHVEVVRDRAQLEKEAADMDHLVRILVR